ncbi:serine hydrolase domain-containing protein [Maribacter sp. HTCC2170]|uniref:serine hydrolase domain-containing protein n=1 Tax=Maribacter sp. (strain HTCC2170 / KCCM 42371) TaxID=313603 RepID=UPI0002DE7BC9|nr:serine hydrolase [Maribacter sp. HTCC2170]
MKPRSFFNFSIVLLLICGCSNDSDTNENDIPAPTGMFFPQIDGNDWEVVTPSQLEWNIDKEEELYDYLESTDTKGFIVLKNGRIVIEKYFNGHNQNASWTWFSAAKSLTATFVGIAQDEGLLNINNKTSDYLGQNWSQLTTEKQDLITVKHHMTMTTGLTPHLGEFAPWVCTLPICLEYTADAGTIWAYHQGAFMLLQEMITQSSGMSFQEYSKIKIADKIGMNGNWTSSLGLNIYNSSTRSMARFGLLMLNQGTWDGSAVVSENFFNEMTNTSQDINTSYGYLWWLNGKENVVGTTTTISLPGPLVPNAPNDMFAALGANDQKIYVVPSKGLVIVRCGESAGEMQLGPSSYDNELWGKINDVIN